MSPRVVTGFVLGLIILMAAFPAMGASAAFQETIYDPGRLKPIDSEPRLKIGDQAPDFSLPSLGGGPITLSRFRGRKNVVLSFVPAAWTPVCSDQWPGYNILQEMFEENDAVLIGITVDNLPSLHAWTRRMGNLWFFVASDFWPHGSAAKAYGVFRSDGLAERAVFVVDKNGRIRYTEVSDINVRPNLEALLTALQSIHQP